MKGDEQIPMIIDWQHHFSPEEIYIKRGGRPGQAIIKDGKVAGRLRQELYQIESHVEFMDVSGIDMAVLSASPDSVEDCKLTDDAYARIMRDHPKRFLCIAPCIPTKGEPALQELDRAVTVLGLKGVVISPQNDGVPIDSRALWPFYEKVDRLNIPIFIHITLSPVGYDALDAPYNLDVVMTREFDIAAATARLILGGVLTEFPDLKFVISHTGGGIASILDRIERYVDVWGDRFWTELGGTPPFEEPYGESFRKYFDKIFFDLAGFEGRMNAVKCALTAISPDRLVFGTDYPYNFTKNPDGVKHYIEEIKKLDLPTVSIEGILGGNAAGLLGIQTRE